MPYAFWPYINQDKSKSKCLAALYTYTGTQSIFTVCLVLDQYVLLEKFSINQIHMIKVISNQKYMKKDLVHKIHFRQILCTFFETLHSAFYLPTECLQIFTVWVTYLHCTSVCIFVVGLQTCLTRLFAKVQYAQIISEEGLSFLCIALFKRYFFNFLSNNTQVLKFCQKFCAYCGSEGDFEVVTESTS